ncbi:MAG: energy transducer TonB [Bacteroidetes bacterium]|nr:energy transducer TonB [Bacteroidota bacterium]
MKYIFTLILILTIQTIFAQNGDLTSDNYYNFYKKSDGKPITTNWLRRTEIVPIIQDELEKYGFKNSCEFKLYKLENGQFIILEMYNEEFNFGFVCKTGHDAKPKETHRTEKSDFAITYDYLGKSSGYVKVDLPKNIYILSENCYWYQYENDKYEKNDFVNRDVIIEILKSDIQKVLAEYKDLEKAFEETKWKQVQPDPQFGGFIFVDNWAKFVDGKEGVEKYISENLKYPEQAKKKKIEEEIILEYEIRPDGTIGEINVIQGKNEILISECKRVIENMPQWKPAKQQGKAISIKYGQKFIFKL